MRKEGLLVIVLLISSAVVSVSYTHAITTTPAIETLIANEINQDSLIQIVTAICQGTVGPTGDRNYNPRTQGTPNGDLAVSTVQSLFQSWGLDHVEIYTNPTSLSNCWWLKTWEITSPQYTFLSTWPLSHSPGGDVTANLVFVGSGAASYYTAHPTLDVSGKIVLCNASANTAYTQAVTNRGAVGLLYYTTNPGIYDGASANTAVTGSITYASTKTAPCASISYTDGVALKTLLKTQDVMVHLKVDAENIPTGQSKSVIATIDGTDPSGNYFILYGHLNSDSGGPGCDDNGSGVASFMEVARAIQTLINEGVIPRPKYGIKFFAIGSETSDSRAWLNAKSPAELAKIIAGCNFDQAGLGTENNIEQIEGTDKAICQQVLLVCKDLKEQYSGTYWDTSNFQFIPYLGGSDHTNFINKNIPTTYIWTDWTLRTATNPPAWGGNTVTIAGNPYYTSAAGDTVQNTVMVEPFNMLWISRMGGLLATRFVDFPSIPLTMQVSPSGAGTTTPTSWWYYLGDTVTISATATNGYVFNSWTGTGLGSYSGSLKDETITMNGPITETANFYNVNGLLPPLPRSGGEFKAGSTIPVKFQLTDANGNYVSNAVGQVYFDGISAGSFRYDLSASQYIFNLKTAKGLTGSHTITVKLSNGETVATSIITMK